jgi:hypothetical protein
VGHGEVCLSILGHSRGGIFAFRVPVTGARPATLHATAISFQSELPLFLLRDSQFRELIAYPWSSWACVNEFIAQKVGAQRAVGAALLVCVFVASEKHILVKEWSWNGIGMVNSKPITPQFVLTSENTLKRKQEQEKSQFSSENQQFGMCRNVRHECAKAPECRIMFFRVEFASKAAQDSKKPKAPRAIGALKSGTAKMCFPQNHPSSSPLKSKPAGISSRDSRLSRAVSRTPRQG